MKEKIDELLYESEKSKPDVLSEMNHIIIITSGACAEELIKCIKASD